MSLSGRTAKGRGIEVSGAETYIDTSALVPWYIPEDCTPAVTTFLLKHKPVSVSSLTLVEFRSVLGRKKARREISADDEAIVHDAFIKELSDGVLVEQEIPRKTFEVAARLVAMFSRYRLYSLDAIHLAVAQETGARTFATADRDLAQVAREMGLKVAYFGPT
jgi:predicted nucleic acid-binding protein